MSTKGPKLGVKPPPSTFQKPLKADFLSLFKAVGKGFGHGVTGKWPELASDAVEALASLGLATDPEELSFLLIKRSMVSGLFTLLEENLSTLLSNLDKDAENLISKLDGVYPDTYVDKRFLSYPSDIAVIQQLKDILAKWLTDCGLERVSTENIVARLPSYFIYALNQEWRKNLKSYRPILESIDTPFSKAGEREWAWAEYTALLEKKINEGIFDEPFSLSQIYVPLNAYFNEDAKSKDNLSEASHLKKNQKKVVVALAEEIMAWLEKADAHDAIRVISGGPGSGKSSFARILSAEVSRKGELKVLFIPLHLIDPSKEIVDEVGRFVRSEGVLTHNPLDPQTQESNLLVIFDGLDELSSQGKAAAETARAFVREIEQLTHRCNLHKTRLRILLSGREVVVQENESEFRRARQILTVLPYSISSGRLEHHTGDDDAGYDDPCGLLKIDLRQRWWKNYGTLTAKGYEGLPKHLDRSDLAEVTAQPLLNYLVALSYSREKIDFSKNVNLNSVYGDLVAAVHERGYEKHRAYAPIRHMTVQEFSRVLEEIGLAAWHGDGRTTTVKEIEEHCKSSGLGAMLSLFQEGAQAGVTRLLAAFFFRQHGQRSTGDPTFVFTHKSFGEYLTSLRILRAVERMCRELQSRVDNPDMGWDEREALKHWVQIAGPSAMSSYLHTFLKSEIALKTPAMVLVWQNQLSKLFAYMLKHGLPMEQVGITRFKDALFQSRNAEEALLLATNVCARVTRQLIKVNQSDPTVFGAWFKRVQGQRLGPESALVARCLSFLDLKGCCLDIGDFYGADLSNSNLEGAFAHYACFGHANLSSANLSHSIFTGTMCENTNFRDANLSYAHFTEANLEGSILIGAILTKTEFKDAILIRTDVRLEDLSEKQVIGARLNRGAKQLLRRHSKIAAAAPDFASDTDDGVPFIQE